MKSTKTVWPFEKKKFRYWAEEKKVTVAQPPEESRLLSTALSTAENRFEFAKNVPLSAHIIITRKTNITHLKTSFLELSQTQYSGASVTRWSLYR